MRYLVVLLLCVPLQFALITFRTPVEKFVFDSLEFIRVRLKSLINDFVEELSGGDIIESNYNTGGNNNAPVSFEAQVSHPPQVLYRVGQIAVNIEIAYIGIIIGWKFNKNEFDEPIYELLTDHPHVPEYKTKAPQSKLVILEFIQVFHEEGAKYFDSFDVHKSQYVPKPWLRVLYPQD